MAHKELRHIQKMKSTALQARLRRLAKHPLQKKRTTGEHIDNFFSWGWSSVKYYSVGLWNYVDEDHCFLLAAGIAFNVLYSIIPLSLLLFYFLSKAISSDVRAAEIVLRYVTQSIPVPSYRESIMQWFTAQLATIESSGEIAGIIGLITLLWISSALFATLRTSVNAIFGMSPKKSLLILKLRDFGLIFVVIILLLAATIFTPLVGFLKDVHVAWMPQWLLQFVNSAIAKFTTIGISLVVFVILFRMLPHERLPRKVIFVSAMTTVVLTEAMKSVFTYYIQQISSVGVLYGAYAFLIGISLWLYYAGLVFTIGAEVGWLYRERHDIFLPHTAAHPGTHANDPAAIEAYHDAKESPVKPAENLPPA